MLLDRAACDRARRSRDARFDGRFFIGVITTGIYCRPVCPARSPKDENVHYFPTAAAAEAAGFRPCRRCRPEVAPGTPAWVGTSAVVSRALRLIADGALDREDVNRLADRVGVTGRHLRRLFVEHLGAPPLDIAVARRVHFAGRLLAETTLSCAAVAQASGFGSIRRFNALVRRTFRRTPSEIRRRARSHAVPNPGCYRFRLAYRPPYDWTALLQFLAARATPGVEVVADGRYHRTIALDGDAGVLSVAHASDGHALLLDVRSSNPALLLPTVERVRAMFDLGADPAAIAARLAGDRLLSPIVARHPGLRTPGAWDGFELAVRAILGQQVSVRAATTIAGRVAHRFGTHLTVTSLGADGRNRSAVLDRLFPTPAQLADAPLEEVGLIATRAGAIRALARAVQAGELTLAPTADPDRTAAALQQLPGIGAWTAAYVAMRALGEPDAFPDGDLVVRRLAGDLDRRALLSRAEAWRPWRAYAVMLLWQAAVDRAAAGTPETTDATDPIPMDRPHALRAAAGGRRRLRHRPAADGAQPV